MESVSVDSGERREGGVTVRFGDALGLIDMFIILMQ
jgi:hypothetical protein